MKPQYDPERDGNVFRWILKASSEVRATKQPADKPGRFTQRERSEMRDYDESIDADENARFVILRAARAAKRLGR